MSSPLPITRWIIRLSSRQVMNHKKAWHGPIPRPCPANSHYHSYSHHIPVSTGLQSVQAPSRIEMNTPHTPCIRHKSSLVMDSVKVFEKDGWGGKMSKSVADSNTGPSEAWPLISNQTVGPNCQIWPIRPRHFAFHGWWMHFYARSFKVDCGIHFLHADVWKRPGDW